MMKPFERLELATTPDEKIRVLRAVYMLGFKKGQFWPELEGIGMVEEVNESFRDDVL